MRPDTTLKVSLLTSLLVLLLNTQLTATAAEAGDEYTSVKATIAQNLTKLEGLGGGIKPFNDRVAQLDTLNETDKTAALSQLKSLSASVVEQLKSITELRTKKPSAIKKVVAVNVPSSRGVGREQTDSLVMAFVQTQQAKGNPTFNDSSFNGSGNEYINAVANDIINREFSGLGFPCKGPFQLERFRNLHRLNEMKKQGRDISNWLAYHNSTEQIAAAAKQDSARVPELSQRVRYLEQQLGMGPLSGSVDINQFR